eukprot:TRINITY_DN48656_c0_g1_i1.p1 TRINITY_DN48656_c0_g1~~TRINITY_DN48656_c0_g1_i1.p1  ORF type:complete len:380 (-),score=46.11 TRINITY_DN48656_c0_g1_i1:227-1366(-)
MPQVVQQEEPIEAFSLTGLWRSSLAQMEVFRERPAPTCVFTLCLACWSAALYRIWNPLQTDPDVAGVCLVRDAVFSPHSSEWKRYLLHVVWPFEATYIRGFFMSLALLLEGYAFEYEVGTQYFAAVMVGCHASASAILLYFRFTVCHVSLEAVIAALAVLMHRANPKIHTDGVDKSIRVPFAIEPRWHLWMVEVVLLLLANDFSGALVTHGVGYAVGAVCVFRDPEVLLGALGALRRGSPRVGYIIHIALFLFAVFFMPITAAEYPTDVVSALLDGRALRWAWWQSAVPSSPPLLHLALVGLAGPEALFLMKLLIVSVLPLLFSPFSAWLRVYSVACVILVMYVMNMAVWRFPHIGFCVLLYLVWAFWKLPNMKALKYD